MLENTLVKRRSRQLASTDSDRLFRRLKEINGRFGPVHFLFQPGVIYAVNDIPAWPHVAEHVARALEQFSEVADGLDDFLQVEFFGKAGNTVEGSTRVN